MSSDTASGSEAAPRRARRSVWPLLRDIVVIVLVAIVVSFVVKTFVVRSFYIPSGSMQQTLEIEDRIFVDELTPRFTGYDRGDVVVFRDPGGWLPVTPRTQQTPWEGAVDWLLSLVGLSASDSKDHLVKRVVGLPGDHVVCCNPIGQVMVNDVPIDETPYLNLDPGQSVPAKKEFDVTVPEGALWVLGDNRDHSRDSRYNVDQPTHGFVPLDNVVGRAFLITWPLNRIGFIDGHHDVFAGVPAPADG
ncbi:signal peptidase I [Microbacterium sp. No. 7]|uniref:signal peptidase I n=1 Tax=Microbacterium sp. No. 7 TaxID=1714373 RepID=UPI0006D1F8C9|nr:signal peptidase I [Microbacterium sp. No. 7]ALJ20328.1 signal peptidase I [Microbacterium sp. No. 7]